MAFAYVLDPTNQYQNRAGVNNVHGYFKVYISNTDDIAVTYKNFNGTLNPERIDIDNNGRAVIIADSSRPYRVEMYEPNGTPVFTQYPVWCVASGGGMTMVDIQSTDGSVSVQKTSSGGMTTYDLSTNPEDDPAFLDWIKCSWYDLVDGAYVPRYASGTMSVGARGVVLSAGMHYHITATVRANKSGATPFYDNIGVHFSLFDGENTVGVQDFIRIVDHSLGLSQDFQVDADIHVGSIDSQLVVSIDGAMEGVSFNLVSLDAHRVYSGIPKIPDGVARQDWVEQNYQKKLVAGDNITIDPVTNTISAEEQEQADWDEESTSSPAFIKHKPTIPAAQVNSDWNADSGVAQILNKPNLSTVATTGDYEDLNNRPTIPAAQVNSDWNADSGVAQILNKPNLATVAESGSYNDLSDKPSIPAAQVNSDWNANSGVAQILNKPNLATVAESGSYEDLTDKPTIPAAQVNSDWNATEGVSRILNKPNLSVYAEKSELASVATSGNYSDLSGKPNLSVYAEKSELASVATSGSYNSLTDKPTIPAAQVPADWNATEGPSRILNKPNIPSYSPTQMDAVNSGINSTKVSAYDSHIADTDIHVTPAQKTSWNAKEDSINKKQSIDDTSTTDFPSSKAVADFVNSSVATNTANFLGSYTLADLGLSYGATNQQIATALGSVQFSSTPTNNDYVYVEIQNPQTTGIDDSVERFKFNGASWGYEYTLNNSTFTAQEKATLESGLTSSDKTAYDNHIADTGIHVTSAQKSAWNAKQDAISDLSDIRSGAESGATAVQPGDLASVATSGNYSDLSGTPDLSVYAEKSELAAVATSGSYSDLTNKPTIPAPQVNSDWNADSGVAQILNKPNLASVAISGSYNDLTDKPTLPSGGTLVYIGSANVNHKFDNITVSTVTATVPSGYTFKCWIGNSDTTYGGVLGFYNRTSNPTNVRTAYAGGNSSQRTVACIFIATKDA